MLLDHRTYRVKPGKLAAHLEIYQKHGMAVQTKHLGQPLAYLITETGEINTYVHIWVYEDAGDRAKKRAAMQADPGWKEYLRISGEAGYLEHQDNKLMTPAAFFPIKR